MNISTPYFKENNNDEIYIPLAKPSITKKEMFFKLLTKITKLTLKS